MDRKAVLIRGVPFELAPFGDYVSDMIAVTGDFYEADILDEIARRVSGGVLIDVGAHIGNHSAYLARFVPHAAVYAFEPIPENVAILRRNAPDVVVHAVALGDRPGTARFEQDAVNAGHSRVSVNGEIVVPMATLDSFGFEGVTLVKIDVEGYEPQVLAGARETIARWHPLIVIEDWTETYGALLPGYELVAEWRERFQTFMYQWAS